MLTDVLYFAAVCAIYNRETIGSFHQAWSESGQYSWRGVEIRYSKKVVFTSELR